MAGYLCHPLQKGSFLLTIFIDFLHCTLATTFAKSVYLEFLMMLVPYGQSSWIPEISFPSHMIL